MSRMVMGDIAIDFSIYNQIFIFKSRRWQVYALAGFSLYKEADIRRLFKRCQVLHSTTDNHPAYTCHRQTFPSWATARAVQQLQQLQQLQLNYTHLKSLFINPYYCRVLSQEFRKK